MYLFYDFFIHSDAKINLGWLGKFIVSPQNHRVHHSSLKKHYDKNFGEIDLNIMSGFVDWLEDSKIEEKKIDSNDLIYNFRTKSS